MAYDGTVVIATSLDTKGAEAGLAKLRTIVSSSTIPDAILKMGKAIASTYGDYEKLSSGVKKLREGFQNASLQLKFFVMENGNAALANVTQVAALKPLEIAVGALTGKLSLLTAAKALATKAQLALSAAWMANPHGVILAALTALTVGIVAIASATRKESDELKALREESEAIKKGQEDFAASVQASTAAFDDNVKGIEANAIASGNLLGKVKDLAAENDGTAESEYRLKAAIDAFNASTGETLLTYDEQSKAVIGLTDDLDAYIAMTLEAAKAEAYRERIAELAGEQALAEIELARALEHKKDLEDAGLDTTMAAGHAYQIMTYEQREAVKQYKEATDAVDYYTGEQERLSSELDTYIGIVGKVTAANGDARLAGLNQMAALRGLSATYGMSTTEIVAELARLNISHEEWAAMQEENAACASAAIQEYALKTGGSYTEIEAAIQQSGLSAEEWVARQEGAYTRAEEVLNRLVDAHYNMNEQIKVSDDQSLADRNANIEANQAAVDTYASNLDAIAAHVAELNAQAGEQGFEINSRLWEELQAGTPESMDLAADILESIQLTDGQWQQLNDNFSNGLAGTLDTVATGLLPDGENNPAQTMLDELVAVLEADTTVGTATTGVMDAALSSANSHVESLDLSQVGKNMTDGIVKGILAGTSDITAAVRAAIEAGHAEAKAADSQKSPSKWWEKFGLNSTLGWADGYRKGERYIVTAQSELVNTVKSNALSHAFMLPAYAAAPPYNAGGQSVSSSGPTLVIENQNVNMHPRDPYEVEQQALRAALALAFN